MTLKRFRQTRIANKLLVFFAVVLAVIMFSAIANVIGLGSRVYAVGEPTLTSVVPNTAMNVGGDTITITGSNFDSSTVVRIGASAPIVVTLVDSGTVTFTLPASSYASFADIKVTNSTGQNTVMASAFTYTIVGPTLTSITPAQGPLTGNQAVTIKGSNFDQGKVAFKQVSGGTYYSCGLAIIGKVYCWGYNNYGQLGNGNTIQSLIPIPVNTDGVLAGKKIVKIATGDSHTVALASDGKIYAWGFNDYGQLGNNSTTQSSVPVEVDSSGVLNGKSIVNISAGNHNSLALDNEGKVYAWGNNAYGQLGDDTKTNSSYAVAVDTTGVLANKVIKSIASGQTHSLAIDSDGRVYAWGAGNVGQLGNGTTSHSSIPVLVSTTGVLAGKIITQIAGGAYHSIALDSDGKIYTWGGYNGHGLLGNNTTSYSASPVAVYSTGALNSKVISQISAGVWHSAALDSNGNVYTWGDNNNGTLGNNSTTQSIVPAATTSTGVLSGKFISSISAGGYHVLAIDSNNGAYTWGYGYYGQLGNNLQAMSTVPTIPSIVYDTPRVSFDGTALTNVTFTNSTTLTATTPPHAAGVVDLSVTNYDGQSATLANAYEYKTAPGVTSITPNSGFVTGGDTAIITGVGFTNSTKLKIGGTTVTPTFIDVNTLSLVVPASTSPGVFDIVITDEYSQSTTLAGAYTYIMPAPTITSITPNRGPVTGNQTVTIKGSNFDQGKVGFKQMTGGYGFTCGLTTLGKVYCWGANNYGQLGNNSTTDTLTPTLVDVTGVLKNKAIVSITSGRYHTLALDSQGKVYSWGYNGNGNLGNNSTTDSLVPVEVDASGVLAGKVITQVQAGHSSSFALDSNGKIYAWGDSSYGALGSNVSGVNPSPIAVDTDGVLSGKTIIKISAGYYFGSALDTDGKIYSWGYNNYGQLGDGTTTNRAVPVAVNMTGALKDKTIVNIASGYYASHSVVTDSDGKVYSWGLNNKGQLGNNSTTSSSVPVSVTSTGVLSGKNIISVATGISHTTALDNLGKIYAWGGDSYTILGNNPRASSTVPVAVYSAGALSGKFVSSIYVGCYHTYAIDSNYQAYVWGNIYDGSTANSIPTAITNITELPKVGLGEDIVTNINLVDSNTITATTPPRSAGLVDVKVIEPDNQIATLTNGYKYALPSLINSITPNSGFIAGGDSVVISGTDFSDKTTVKFGGISVTPVFIDENTIMVTAPAVTSPGQVDISFMDEFNQIDTLKDAYTYNLPAPEITSITPNTGPVVGGQTVTVKGKGFDKGELAFKQISSGSDHTCGLTTLGKVYCWGSNSNGNFGNGTTTGSTTPVYIDLSNGVLSGKSIISLQAGGGYTMALDSEGELYAWGYNYYGSLGNGTNTNSLEPISVSEVGILKDKKITKFSAGTSFVLALDSDGKLYSWGNNGMGQLGNGTDINSTSPALLDMTGVLSGKTIASITAGFYHSAVIDSEGKVYTWGYNTHGQLGNNSNAGSSIPVAVYADGLLSNKKIISIATGWCHTVAVDSDGVVYAWGYNNYGQLGNNSTAASNIPVAVYKAGVLANKYITSVSVSGYDMHTVALDRDGNVYTWGLGTSGQLGNGSTSNSIVPTAINSSGVLSGKSIKSISAGYTYTSVLGSDGHAYGWGNNANGQLGNNSSSNSSVPVSITPTYNLPTLTIGGVPANNVAFVNSTTLTAKTPAHAAGLVDVTITNYDAQSATLANSYNYKAPPVISSISPNSGLVTGGNSVYVTGSNFTDSTTITIGGVLAGVTFIDENNIIVNVPVSANPGKVTVAATDEFSQTGSLADGYEYRLASPMVTSVSPNKSVMAGGGVVTVTGTNFATKTTGSWYKLLIGGVEATNVKVVNSTTLTATIPAHTPGMVDVDLTSDYTDPAKLANSFTYLPDAYSFAVMPCSSDAINSDGLNCKIMATQPGRFKIEAKDKNGNLVTSTHDIILSLSTTSGSGSFARVTGTKADGSPILSWGVSTATIKAGDSSVDLYCRDSMAGTPTISVKDILNTSTGKNVTIGSRYKFLVTGVSDPTSAGTPSSVTVQAIDYTGVPQSDYRGTIHFTSTDLMATVPTNYTFVSTDRGRKTFTNGVVFRTEGVWQVIATDVTDSIVTGLQDSIHVSAPTEGTISKLKFITQPQSFPLDEISNVITVQTQDVTDQVIVTEKDETIYLKTNSKTGQFSFDDGQTWSSPDVNGTIQAKILAGSSSMNFRYKDATNGTFNLHASNSATGDFGWAPDDQTITIGVGAPTKFDLSSVSTSGTGDWFPVTIKLKDSNDNFVSTQTDITYKMKGTNGSKLSLSADGSNAADEINGQIPAGDMSVIVYAMGTNGGNSVFTVEDTRAIFNDETNLESDSISVYMKVKASNLKLVALKSDVSVNSIETLNISLQDQFGNIATADTDSQITLSSSSPDTRFIPTGSSTWTSNLAVTLLAGHNTVSLNFKQINNGQNITISASSPSFASSSCIISANYHYKLKVSGVKTPIGTGIPTDVTVQVVDYNGVAKTDYIGTIHFTSTDSTSDIPSDYTFQIADRGKHTFVNGVNFKTEGTWGVTATDTSDPLITGTQTPIIVSNDIEVVGEDKPAAKLKFATEPQNVKTDKNSNTITIQALDIDSKVARVTEDTSVYVKTASSTGSVSIDNGATWLTPDANGLFQAKILAGNSSVNILYKDSTAGQYLLSADTNATLNWPGDSQVITVFDEESLPVSLSLEGPAKANTGQWFQVKLSLKDIAGKIVSAPSDISFSLKGFGDTKLSLNSNGFNSVSEINSQFLSGQSSITIYAMSKTAGKRLFTVSDTRVLAVDQANLKSADLNVQISSLASKISINTPKDIVSVHENLPINISVLDEFGNIAPTDADINVTISSSNNESSFSSDGVNNWNSALNVTIPAGGSTASAYFVHPEVQKGITISAKNAEFTQVDHTVDVVAGEYNGKLQFVNPKTNFKAGESAAYTVMLMDDWGNQATSASNVTIGFGSTNTATRNDQPLATWQSIGATNPTAPSQSATKITIPAGSSTASAIYWDDIANASTEISAWDAAKWDRSCVKYTSYNSNICETYSDYFNHSRIYQTLNITANDPSRYEMTISPNVISKNTISSPIIVKLTDNSGNATHYAADTSFDLKTTSLTGDFLDADDNIITKLTYPAGASEATFYYRDSTVSPAAGYSLSLNGSLIGEPQSIRVVDGFASKIELDTNGVSTIKAGQYTPVTIRTLTSDNREVVVLSDKIINLSADDGRFFEKVNSEYREINSITISKEDSRTDVYFMAEQTGDKMLAGSGSGFTVANAELSVLPENFTKLVYSAAPETAEVTKSSDAFTVTSQDLYGNVTIANNTEDTTITLSSDKDGQFSLSNDGGWGIDNIAILAGSTTSSNFYYRSGEMNSITGNLFDPSVLGDHKLSATSGSAQTTATTKIIGQIATNISVEPNTLNLVAGKISDVVNVSLLNSDGTPAIATTDQIVNIKSVNLVNGNSFIATFGADNFSSNGSDITSSVTVKAGTSHSKYYVTSQTAINHRLEISSAQKDYDGSNATPIYAYQTLNVSPDVPSKLNTTTPTQIIHPIQNGTSDETSSPIRIVLADKFGNPTTNESDRDVNLTSTCPTGIFLGSPTGQPIDSIKLLADSPGINIYYRDNAAHADDCQLTASSNGLTDATYSISVREKVFGLIVTSEEQSIIAGSTSAPISISTKDRYGNIVPVEDTTNLSFSAVNSKAKVKATGVAIVGPSSLEIDKGSNVSMALGTNNPLSTSTAISIPVGADTATFTYAYTAEVSGTTTDTVTAESTNQPLGTVTQGITIYDGPATKLRWQDSSLSGRVDDYIPTRIGFLNENGLTTAADKDIIIDLTNNAGNNPSTSQPAGNFYVRNPDTSFSQVNNITVATGQALSQTVYYRQTTTTKTQNFYANSTSYYTQNWPISIKATSGTLEEAFMEKAVTISPLLTSFSTGNFSAQGRAFTEMKINIDKAMPVDTTISLGTSAGSGGAYYDTNTITDDAQLPAHVVTSVVIPAGDTSSNTIYYRQTTQSPIPGYPYANYPTMLQATPVTPAYSAWVARATATVNFSDVTQIEFVSGPDNLEQNQTGVYTFQTKDAMGNITPILPYTYGQQIQNSTCLYLKTTSSNGKIIPSRVSDPECPATSGVVGFRIYGGETSISFNYNDQIVGNPTLSTSNQSGSGGMFATKQINITPAITTKVVIEPDTYGLVRGDEINNMKIKLMSEYDLNANSLGDTTITLTSDSPSGRFKNPTNGLWQDSIDVTIAAGSVDITVSYKDDEAVLGETENIVASSGSLTSGTAKVNIVKGSINSVSFVNDPLTLERQQNGTITVKLIDAFSNETVTTSDTCVYFGTSSSSAIISGANPTKGTSCPSLALPDGSTTYGLTIRAGNSRTTVSYQDDKTGTYQLKTNLLPNLNLNPIKQNIVIIDGEATGLKFDPNSNSIERGGTATTAVSLINAYGAEVPASDDTYFTLTSNSSYGQFAITELNTWTNELVVKIAKDTSRTEILYRDSTSELGDYILTATNTDGLGAPVAADSLTTATANIHIVNGAITELVYTSPEYQTIASHPSKAINLELKNQYGYSVTSPTDQTIYLGSSSDTGEFALDADGPWGISNVKIASGQSNVNIFYRDTTEGKHQVTARTSPNGEELVATQDQTIIRQTLDHFIVTNISTPQRAGTPSSVVVFAVDSEDYAVQWYDGTISFSSPDSDAIYPTDEYTFSPETDRGIHTFTNGIAFKLPGFKDITVTDKINNLTGTQYDIEVLGGNINPVKSVVFISPTAEPVTLDPNENSQRITLQLRDQFNTPTNATLSGGYPLHLTTSSSTGEFATNTSGPWLKTLDINVEQGLSYTRQPIFYRDSNPGNYTIAASDWTNLTDDDNINNDTLDVIIRDLKLEDGLTIKSKDYTGTLIANPYLFSNNASGYISGLVELKSNALDRQTNKAVSANWQITLKDKTNTTTIDNVSFPGKSNINYTSKELSPSHLDTNYLLDSSAALTTNSAKSGREVKNIPISPWLASLNGLSYNRTDSTIDLTLNTTNYDTPTNIPNATIEIPSLKLSFDLNDLLGANLNANSNIKQATNTKSGTYKLKLPVSSFALGEYQTVVTLKESNAILAQDYTNLVVTNPAAPIVPPVTNTTPTNNTPSVPQTAPETASVTQTAVKPTVQTSPVVTQTVTLPAPGLNGVLKSILTSPATPMVVAGSIFGILGLLAVILAYQTYREWRRSKWLIALTKQDQETAADKDAFLKLSAHYLRTPIAILGASVDMMVNVFHSENLSTDTLRQIAVSLKDRSEEILAKTESSLDNQKITMPDIHKTKMQILRSPIFWLPVILSCALTLFINWAVSYYGEQTIGGVTILSQIFTIMFAGIALYTAVREFTIYREKQTKLEDSRVKIKALENIKNQFITDVYEDLSYDVSQLASLVAQDAIVLDNETIKGTIVDASERLTKLVDRFATLCNLSRDNLELTQFNLANLVSDAVHELSLDTQMQASEVMAAIRATKAELHQDEQLLSKVVSSILHAMSTQVSLSSLKLKTSHNHNGQLRLAISGKVNGLVKIADSLFTAQLDTSDVDHFNDREDLTRDENSLDIYLSRLIMRKLGGSLNLIQHGQMETVTLTMPE